MRETMHKIGMETKTRSFLAIVALAMLLSAAMAFAAVATDPNGVTPFMIYGNVSYGNGTQCTNPDVRITNPATGAEWQAETSDGSNRYQIVLTSGTDLNATETLHFNVTDGTSSNTVDHTITADEVWAGGLFCFDLTLEPVRVSIADTTADLSGTVTLPLMITNIGNYGAGTINITYDPAVVHVADVTSSADSTVTAKHIDNTAGLVNISAWNTDGTSGSIVFANVTFTSVEVGSTPLNLTVDTLQDTSHQEIPSVTISNGSITVYTTAPVVNTVTLNTATPNTGDAILVTVDATDDVAVTNVTADGAELTSQGDHIWIGTITATEGTHSVNVSAKDAAGNTGWNNSTSYTATTPDTTLPTIAITSPTDGQTFAADTITVSGTASDNVGLSKVEVKVGSGSWQTASGTTSWTASVTLASGSNTIYARATDTSVNTKETSVTVTYNPPDATLPTIAITSPTDGQTFTTATITVSGTASDNVGLSKVEVKVGSGSWQTASGTTSWTTSVILASGSNTIYARATDTSGNTKETSLTVTYDGELTTADAVTVLQMAVRGEYSEDADVNGDSHVTSVDALMILQRLAIRGEQ